MNQSQKVTKLKNHDLSIFKRLLSVLYGWQKLDSSLHLKPIEQRLNTIQIAILAYVATNKAFVIRVKGIFHAINLRSFSKFCSFF